MIYNFDEIIERKGTGSSKWDNMARTGCKVPDALAMWTADTDFRCPAPIVEAVKKRAEHPVYGYPIVEPEFYTVTQEWVKRRYGWQIEKDWTIFSTGVVPVFQNTIQALTQPGDEVIVQPPVYHVFRPAIEDNGRVVVNNDLIYENGRYTIDFDDLEKKAASPKAKIMIICSPHNPVGRVWTKEELCGIADICVKHNVLMIVDEIHADIAYKGYRHYSLVSLDKRYEENSITCYAPSKIFNTPGLRGSGIVIPNPEIRQKLENQFKKNKVIMQNVFAVPAYIAAYTQCDDYLEQVVEYIEGNANYLDAFLRQNMPKIKMIKPESTFLSWLDCSELGLTSAELADLFLNKAGVAISKGSDFGANGAQFIRINIGCPRATLQKALERIKKCYDDLA